MVDDVNSVAVGVDSHNNVDAESPVSDASTLPESVVCMWSPTAEKVAAAQMTRFMQLVNKRYPTTANLESYHDLYRWSCVYTADFWSLVWEFVGIKSSQRCFQVLAASVAMDAVPEFFIGARLNFAENLLRFGDDRVAILACGEDVEGAVVRVTYAQLHERVRACAGFLRNSGVTIGDRVAGYLPNCVETVVAMLATASIGAIWSCTSPDFGATGVLDRFTQIRPKILFSVNAVRYNGKVHDHVAKLQAVVDGLPTLKCVIVINFVADAPYTLPSAGTNCEWRRYDEAMATAHSVALTFEQLPFNHPLYILFSSGTTGQPKCIVHGAGGVLLQHMKEHVIHGDLSRDDVFFQYTTTGWMMWNWLVSALAVGCTIVLFDGSPFKPTNWVLWDLAEKHGFTRFGTSAKYIQSMQEMDLRPAEKYKLTALEDIYSTGSPLRPESYDFVYEHIKKDVCLASITGGTDIVSLFAGHAHTLPVFRGEIQCRCLGMAVESWRDDGISVEGESGDLVCTRPFPCMPVMFWNDPDKSKYREAYFTRFPGVWYHGDYVWINPATHGVVMLGRSDGTLKPAGVRFGSAELYNLVESEFKDVVADSLAVGQRRPQDTDERVVLFLKMCDGQQLSTELVAKVKSVIRQALSPRHVPAFILPISDIPYTVNGKKVEVAVKRIISNTHTVEQLTASSTLANPQSLLLFKDIPELA